MKAPSVKPVRCAIYTRVSTEHGLDQEFNSLDAQYEAASAPPSHRTGLRRRAGNGNLRCGDGHAKAGLSPTRDRSRDAQGVRKAPIPAQ
jgi:hypothetical protein